MPPIKVAYSACLCVAALLCRGLSSAQVICTADQDQTAVIQNAINTAYTSGTNQVQLVGTCLVSQLVIHDHTDLSGGVLQKLPGDSQHMIVLSSPTDRDWRIHDLELGGNWTKGQATTNADGIHIDFQSEIAIHRGRIEHAYIHGFSGNGVALLHNTHASGASTLLDVYSEYNGQNAF